MFRAKEKNQSHGFTLIEAMVTIGIFLVSLSAVTLFVTQGFKVNRFAIQQSDAINYARKGIDIMIKEIREASPAENGSYPIVTAQNQTLTFYSDIDQDELVERVRYFLDGVNLKKAVSKPSGFPPVYSIEEQISTLSEYVRNDTDPIFYYYNKDFPTDTENNPLPQPIAINEVRLIRIFLKINVDPAYAPADFVLISNSQLRNLKDNL
ncbi:MAG: prepilin-type N-terminal cleavage/methylation domain-containing protein [Patescibacteria group bacterium]|jgi:prepilin-type N-terminal cleavage/methylation domain-containing protein